MDAFDVQAMATEQVRDKDTLLVILGQDAPELLPSFCDFDVFWVDYQDFN